MTAIHAKILTGLGVGIGGIALSDRASAISNACTNHAAAEMENAMTENKAVIEQRDRDRAVGYLGYGDPVSFTEAEQFEVDELAIEFARHRTRALEASQAGEDLRSAINLAYGLLWHMQIDKRDENLKLASDARAALLSVMTKDNQADGITRAKMTDAKFTGAA